MRKHLTLLYALILSTLCALTVTSCGDDEPTPADIEQEDINNGGNGDENGTPDDENGTPDDENGTPGDENGTPGDENRNVAVDLGLPSGIKWAALNLGATSPEEYGDYYAWGETVPNKEEYSWLTYLTSLGGNMRDTATAARLETLFVIMCMAVASTSRLPWPAWPTASVVRSTTWPV